MVKNPVKKANFLSKILMLWTISLFRKGSRKPLKMEDLYETLDSDSSKLLGDKLERAWNEEVAKYQQKGPSSGVSRPSLTRSIVKVFGLRYFLIGLLLFIHIVILRTMQPIFQAWIVQYFDHKNDVAVDQNDALMYALGLIVTTIAIALIYHQTNFHSQLIGMRVRVACGSLIYRKSLRLCKKALNTTDAGQIVNLLSNDLNRFDTLPLFLNCLWITPIQIIVVGYILSRKIGITCVVGLAVLIFTCVPLQSYIARIALVYRGLIAKLSDRRIQLMSELIAGIQVIKMYTWEKAFSSIISSIRNDELKRIKKISFYRGTYISIYVFTERLTMFLTLITFISFGNQMTAEVTYQLTTFFNILQLSVAILLPNALIQMGETIISIKRIEEFLLLNEISTSDSRMIKNDKFKQLNDKTNDNMLKPVGIRINRVSANWISDQLPPTLCDISMKIDPGQLCCLIGPVGSGKTSLLNVLLRELSFNVGTVVINQQDDQLIHQKTNDNGFFTDNPSFRTSYSSQNPWLFSGTLRENILFDQPFDKKKYHQVVKVCSLLKDFEQLPDGDLTVIGERGTRLSGGQRSRVNLARAIYKDSDLYLFDDPLSAVDPCVAQHLFNSCIVQYLRGKTRLLVTHQLDVLKKADFIIFMERGSIKYQGKFETLIKNDEFNELLNRIQEDEGVVDDDDSFSRRESNFNRQERLRMSTKSQDSYAYSIRSELDNDPRGKVEDETTSGSISIRVYIDYFTKGGSVVMLLLLFINFSLSQLATSGADYWLSYWSNVETIRQCLNNTNQCQLDKKLNDSILYNGNGLFRSYENGLLPIDIAVYVYTICIICCIVLTVMRSFLFMNVCINASKRYHNEMLMNILQSTVSFFNDNPSGSILNRFSRDIGIMDEILPKTFLEMIQIFLIIIGIFVVITIVHPWMIIPMIGIAILFYFLRFYYIQTAQNIKRLESNAKSPVFSHINTTLNGLTTIRSHGDAVKLMLCEQFDQYQNDHTKTWSLLIATVTAFVQTLDLTCSLFVACVSISLILSGPENHFGGSVGLAISQSLVLTGMVQYGVKQSTDIQSNMTSVERVIEYTRLPKEQSDEANESPANWPTNGRLAFQNVFMSYKKDDAPVLKNINLTIEPGWKVGIVGRTGAGKSSLISAIFRLSDELQGDIVIDDKSIKNLTLQAVRSNISIIPQSPVLFSESLRYNLDPFGKCTDEELWKVLHDVELDVLKLDQKIMEGGDNLSVGQRQLICLARAILRNNKILILDEATASIDSQTDFLIQKIIRSKFANCTVLTIAHRLNTIIDSDKVLVMENGQVVEFDHPYNLLSKQPNGYFSRMVEQTGDLMAENLMKEASISYHQIHNDLDITDHSIHI